MNCETAREAVWPGPGVGPAPAEARAHVEQCPACRRFFETQAALGRRLTAVSSQNAPAGLRERVRAALADEVQAGRPLGRRRWWAVGGLAAAAAVALMIGLSSPAGDLAEPFAEQGTEIAFASDDFGAVERWLASRLGRPVSLPAITDAQLEGARIVTLEGRAAAAAVYRLHGDLLTYFALPDFTVSGERVMPEHEIRTATAGPYEVAVWGELDGARAVMAQMSRDEVIAIAAECRTKALMRS